jgi:hypothetical protein
MMFILPFLLWGLSNVQLGLINRLMMRPDLPVRNRHLIESVLYKNYESWAIKIGSNFKKQHYYKCKHIPYHEVSIYSRIGLLNAIRRYHPTKESATFHLYAIHHIRGELYKGMTNLSPITNVSKKQLRMGGTNYMYAGHNNDALSNQAVARPDDPQVLWQHIEETADPFTRRCITYKFDYDFNSIRSNLEIARLMECSEERVRSTILRYFVTQHMGIVLVKSTRSPS